MNYSYYRIRERGETKTLELLASQTGLIKEMIFECGVVQEQSNRSGSSPLMNSG
jgi:hypothetical protein